MFQPSNNVSQGNFDLNYLAENQPSMCIPRVFENIDERLVRDVFEQLDLGELDHIDIIERRSEKGEKYKRIFIHFSRWYWNDDAINARRRLIEGKDIKVVYNTPWFWKISANRWTGNNSSTTQRESNEIHEDIRRNVRRGGPRIVFEDSNEVRRDDRRPSDDRRDDRRPSNDRRDDRRHSEARNDRRPSNDRRDDRRPSNEVRRDDIRDDQRHSEARNDRRDDQRHSEARNDRRDDRRPSNDTRYNEAITPVIKESAAEIAQLAVINSTKKRKIVLKKKEPVAQTQVVAVKVEESIKDV